MTFPQCIHYLRGHGHYVGHLVKQGDKLAKTVYDAYMAHHGDKFNIVKQDHLMRVLNEYVGRDLHLTERSVLQNRFGYKIDELR
jgi:hypothetical protein